MLDDSGIDSTGILVDDTRPTTAKTRVIADSQHVVRIDKESKEYISKATQQKILTFLEQHISSLDGIILQDYNKGILTPELIQKVISLAKKKNVLITVDPKFNNFFSYKNVTV
ncbi:MAG: D-glycero-beta-D-manno-heptose-7-phosphate kinase, partial [Ignavibacteria bacterium]|nr:D-glycero-beta-D-manno-heptose-7-phosphate kinase [Ignavibacteria bacterium]